MRLTEITVNGFKRLVSATCNVDGKLIAFVGPNEAGKTSVLRALEWLSSGGELPRASQTRDLRIESKTAVVSARFSLSSADQTSLTQLGLNVTPQTFTLGRRKDGSLEFSCEPRPQFDPLHLKAANEGNATALRMLDANFVKTDDDVRNLTQILMALSESLAEETVEGVAADEIRQRSSELRDFISQRLPEIGDESVEAERDPRTTRPALEEGLRRLDTELEGLVGQLTQATPLAAACRVLFKRAPTFIMFGEHDRSLSDQYDLADEAIRDKPPLALQNLLAAAGTDTGILWQAIERGDKTEIRTLERRINAKLEKVLASSWRQAKLSLQLVLSGTIIEVLVHEDNEEMVASVMSERSEGLRVFVALSCFLSIQDAQKPEEPTDSILLIDEADTHLHLDAQADLVRVLAKQPLASQVLYSTHSPGCLPADLGRGVRLVRRSTTNAKHSQLDNNFWHRSKSVGFSPLLFAMGAGAAAFSALRKAVITEGHTEMVLLPTLIRIANDLEYLDYQVVPGLSTFGGDLHELEMVSGNTAYLVDGDGGGTELRGKLERLGVPKERVLHLPSDMTLEDLVDAEQYVECFNDLLVEAGHTGPRPGTDILSDNLSTRKALEAWCDESGVRGPSKLVVASRLVQWKDVRLADESTVFLNRLHREIEAIVS